MKLQVRYSGVLIVMPLLFAAAPAWALDILHSVAAPEYSQILEEASGVKISDDGTVFVTSEAQGSLLKIVDGGVETISLSPEVFARDDLGGIDQLPDGRLVIVNQDSGRVGVIGPDFKAETLFSDSGSSAGELDDPIAVAVSVNRKIYVGDTKNRRISVFNDQGLYLYSFGPEDSSKESLLAPTHVSLDAEENVYVLEGATRISIFNSDGELLKRLSATELRPLLGDTPEFSAMTSDLDGNLYIGDDVTNRISVLDWREPKLLQQFGALGQSRAQYRKIRDLSVNARGQIAILDTSNAKVEVFQLERTEFARPVKRDSVVFGSAADAACRSIAVLDDQLSLCVRSDDRSVVVLDADGGEVGPFTTEVAKPGAIHSDGRTVAILEKNQMHVFTRGGKKLFSVGRYGTAAGGFKDPGDVFVRGERYYVSDKGNNRIQVFAGDGQFVEEIKDQQDGERLFFEVGPIAVDSQDNLYVADTGGATMVQVISKERRNIAAIGIKGQESIGFDRFHDLDIDRQDRLYVLADTEEEEYRVNIYKDFQPYMSFGAGGNNGTLAWFEEATSMAVRSRSTNSLLVSDPDREKQFRFDLLEFPDPAFGLNIAADRKSIDLTWSSSQSPLIEKYEIEAAPREEGPWKIVAFSLDTGRNLSLQEAGDSAWFRVVSVSGRGLRAAPSAPKHNQFQTITALYTESDYAAAVKLADRLLRIAPDNADARDLLGMSLFRMGDYTRAIAEFRQLAEIDAYRSKALRYQVESYYALGQYLDARGLIDDVLEEEPKDVEPYLICTRLSLELADSIGAVTCAEDGLDRHPEHAELRYLLGKAYIEAGLVEDGLLAYRTIVEQHPEDQAIRLKIGNDLQRLGRHQEALAQFQAIAAADPDSGAAAVGKSRALLSLDREDEAKAIAIRLSGDKETRGDGYYLLGKIAAKQGNHKEAVLRLTRAGSDSPQVVDAWLSLARSYEALGQQNNAVKSLAQGIEHNPEAFELQLMAGRLELEAGRYPEANRYLSAAVSFDPQSLDAQRFYASSLYETRNYRSASLHAEAAAKIAPRDMDVLVLQADIANQQGKTASAIEFLKTAISIEAASAELQYRIGRVYQDANLFDDSREHLERAAAIRPDWAEPHVAMGNLFRKRRRFDDAVASFEKAIEIDPSEENRTLLNLAFAERKKSLEFDNNAPQLLLADLNLQRVFSAAYKKYQDQPIGSVKVENAAATDYGNLQLSFQIKEFMDFPTSVDVPKVAGNETLEVPIRATFNNRILEVDEDTGVQVEVRLHYQVDGKKDSISLTQPMTIYGKNAIVWKNAQMIGSFVTPKDDTLRDYVRQVVNAYQPDPGPLNKNLVAAMAYFSSLSALGTNYIVDPNTPFTELRDDQIDYVQFPRETLRLKSGDCDDLSVLISAGLENLGIRTAFIEVPGHLFLMFDTGLGAESADLISQDHSLLAIHDDRIWIPLEATMVNTGFNEAWAEGARKYQAALAARQLGIIDLREAWQQYKPVTLRKAGYNIDLPEPQRTESLVKQARNLLLTKSIDRLLLPYQTMVANNPRDLAARLQIAILYTRYGLYDDAEIAFEALNELAPNDSAVKTNHGNLYFLQEEYAAAIDSYRRAIELDGEDGGIWINLSMAQYKAGELAKARTSYQKAVILNDNFKQEYDAYSKLLSQ